VDYVIIGHSERRHLFGETDEATARKLDAVLGLGMKPILAVGELREEREASRTPEVLQRQLTAAFADIERLPEGFVVAYEPVWAIGTGLTATPETAQQACADVRRIIRERYGGDTAEACRIQYGGSVNAENAAALASQADIDGLLVGGASLNAEAFAAICRAVASAKGQ
jgi:triosephosphate isomerase